MLTSTGSQRTDSLGGLGDRYYFDGFTDRYVKTAVTTIFSAKSRILSDCYQRISTDVQLFGTKWRQGYRRILSCGGWDVGGQPKREPIINYDHASHMDSVEIGKVVSPNPNSRSISWIETLAPSDSFITIADVHIGTILNHGQVSRVFT